ncbi:RcnB family protein [Pseudomonas sp. efr-133-TYG-103a]|jgi:Ni/Co efflux regulator RcnB|uniref:RcnB family protein n=1 Tax=Pseudomonas sp. efr-133-TYG-103a TaxID=3040308 RepID=UPI0025543AEF|nr:RcnB family protein [Pseudomonas sp. efr-133-TYG-103a]
MNLKTLMACAAIATCLSGTSLMAQAQTASNASVQAEHTNQRYKVGDTAPDLYKEERVGIKDWQDKHLTAPAEDSQWVMINDKYVLVNVSDGKILDIAPVKTKPLKK